MLLARPASSSNVTLCERQNPGAPELTRARTHGRPLASSLLALPRKPALPFLTGARKLSKLSAQPGANPAAEESQRTSLLSLLPARLKRPIPPLRTSIFPTPPHPSGFHRGQSPEPGVPRLESRFQHFGQRPDAPSPLGWRWRAFSKARSSFLRSSGEEPLKLWPPRVLRASLSPVLQPASRCQGNDLLRKKGNACTPEPGGVVAAGSWARAPVFPRRYSLSPAGT